MLTAKGHPGTLPAICGTFVIGGFTNINRRNKQVTASWEKPKFSCSLLFYANFYHDCERIRIKKAAKNQFC